MTMNEHNPLDLSQAYPQIARQANKNPRGYSVNFSKRVLELDPTKSLGVMLGHVCIKSDIPIAWVSKKLGCSRQSVYMWFLGESRPGPRKTGDITLLLRQLAGIDPAN